MRKKRIMVIGPSGSGKTTLALILENNRQNPKKSQDIIFRPLTMDVPGAYLENSWMYKYIISATQDASQVLLLADSTQSNNIYPPGFAKALQKPTVGVITKVDCLEGNPQRSIRALQEAGVPGPYFLVCLTTQSGIEALREHLFQTERSEE